MLGLNNTELPSWRSKRVFTVWFRSAMIVLVWLNCHSLYGQSNWTVEIGSVGSSLSFIGLMVDINVMNTPNAEPLQSIRLASGYGLTRMDNAQFLPIECRFVLFRGSSHVEAMIGVNVQTYWAPPPPSFGSLRIGRSFLCPSTGVVYRFDPEDGGFFFRIGIGVTYVIADTKFFPQMVLGYGWAF